MRFFILNVKRVLFSPKMFISLLLTLACIILGNVIAFQGIYKVEGLSLFFAASAIRGFSPISLLAAIICTLPSSSQIIEDSLNHLLRLQLVRISKLKYLAVILLTGIVVSVITLSLPYLLLLCVNLIVTPYKELYIGEYSGVLKSLFDTNQFLYSVFTVVWYGIWGGVFSVFGVASSVFLKRKLAAVFVPTIYMVLGGVGFAVLEMSYLEPVGTISLGYQKDLTLFLVSIHLLCILVVSILIICISLYKHPEDYI